ncbi:hypothetical protein EW145_g6370 [Phellinidium pouzarii]|uniref:NADP-dependent oxidoreductase domain-containing protein n=1 Tax=Phellinidium pouzarii TaxID=167371 RepID=A0A4S4KWR8_9AGAM|nr:hypothetical protein EW145_g6370 [Phellinidium pouzarii]
MFYTPLPNDDGDVDSNAKAHHRAEKRRALKSHFSRLFAVLLLMYFAFTGLRSVLRLSKTTSFRGSLSSGCHSAQRNASTKAAGSSSSSLPTHYQLPSGDRIPSVALGVWKAGKGEVGTAVKACNNPNTRRLVAYSTDRQHLSPATVILTNEEEVGQAIRESGITRSDIWLTSKLWNNFHAPEDVESALDDSLNKLGTEYLDLYLMHWPIAFEKEPGPDGNSIYAENLSENPYPTWQKLEEMVEKGKVRNIGISNFNIRRIQNLTANPLKVQPAVNQVELNFWNPQPELVKWSKENGLLLEAYSPLGSNNQVGNTLRIPEVKNIADKLGITPAQAVISWHVQRGTIVLPKSVTPSRIEENLQVTALPQDLFEKLEAAAAAHPPQRVVNPSKSWGLNFDVFEY